MNEEIMNITDLSDTDIKFTCDFAGDACEYWDYDFSASVHGEPEYNQNFNRSEIEQLRLNCKRILQATDGIEGAN